MRYPNHLKFKGGYHGGVYGGVYVIVMEGVINNNKMLMHKI